MALKRCEIMTEQYMARAHVMIWHGTYTITIPVRIARDMQLQKGDPVQFTISKIHEGKIPEAPE